VTGQLPRVISTVTATAVTDGGATETVVIVSGAVSTNTVNDTVTVFGMIDITPGTSATAVVVKVYRGATKAGTQIGATETGTLAATAHGAIPFAFSDQPGLVASQQYCVSVTETAAAADGTVNVATLAGYVS
jgi:hypothetical protein